MNDLITMSCPSCGGKLSITPNTPTLVCQHCGTEHMIRWEAGSVLLESFARCPQCNRNDKVQKASAILAGQSGTLLAQRLLPPAKPIPPTQPKLPMRRTQIISSIVASSILGLLALWVIFGTKFDVLTLCSGVALIIVAIIPTLREVWLQEKRKTEYNNWRQAVQGQDKAVKVWNLILQSWNQLYYCARDDCVFVLGAKTFAPSSIMTEYLHKLQDNEIKKELAIKSQEPLIQDNRQVDEEKSFWTWAVLVAILLVCLALSVWLAISLK